MPTIARRLLAPGLALLAACAPALPGVSGVPGTAPAPGARWVPPADRVREAPVPAPLPEVPADVAARRGALTLADVLDLALRTSPDTRVTWSTARAQAAAYGAARGAAFPSLDADLSVTALQTAATQGRRAVRQTIYGPSASLTWLLLDVGGRAGTVGAAREALVAADWTHNAAIATVVQQTARAYYDYVGTRALLGARRRTLDEARVNLQAAEDRRRVGVATIADVLQARTAVGQALLQVQQAEGQLLTTRGALAASVGLPVTADIDADSLAGLAPVAPLADSVEALVQGALRARPELAAQAATWEAARQRARVAQAARLPALTATGTAGRTYVEGSSGGSNFYTVGVGLAIPLFNGFTWEYNARAARERADAERARVDQLARQVTVEVFSAYHALRTAAQAAGTAADLLASATESADAARARYKEGVGSLLELLAAENALADARAQEVAARLGWHAALVDLARASALLEPDGSTGLHLAPALPADSTR